MSKETYQVKAYDSNKKPWILGSTDDLEAVLEMVRNVMTNRKEYHAVTVQKVAGGNNG